MWVKVSNGKNGKKQGYSNISKTFNITFKDWYNIGIPFQIIASITVYYITLVKSIFKLSEYRHNNILMTL